MGDEKMNLQQFAERYGLQIDKGVIWGPQGVIFRALAGWFYFGVNIGQHKFNPVTQAKDAIEAIGLQYVAPAKPNHQGRRALLIVKKSDGWYVADKTGPFKTRELARAERARLKNNAQETPAKGA